MPLVLTLARPTRRGAAPARGRLPAAELAPVADAGEEVFHAGVVHDGGDAGEAGADDADVHFVDAIFIHELLSERREGNGRGG